MPITFQSEDIDFKLEKPEMVISWLESIALTEGSNIEQLSYIFCSDEYLLNINKEYLSHDYYTDIITFPYRQGKVVESDIFISIDRIKDHAVVYKTTFDRELMRVVAHGLLHLIGYNDKTDEDQEKMTEMENKSLDQLILLNQ